MFDRTLFTFNRLKTTIGLDIGNDSIKFVKLKKKGKTYTLISYGIVPWEKNSLDASENIAEALKTLLKNEKDSCPIFTSIAGSGVFIQSFSITHLPENKLKDTVRLASQKYISMPIEKTNLAFKEIGEIEERKLKKKKVLIVAAAKELIENRLKILNKAELEVEGITAESFAYWNLVKLVNPDPENFAIIDIGKESSKISIYENNNLNFEREVITSGHSITEAINEAIKKLDSISYDEALDWIKKYGLKDLKEDIKDKEHRDKIVKAIIPVVQRLISEIQRTFSYYSQKNPGFSIKRIFLVGGTAMLPGLKEFMKEKLGYEVSILNPFENSDLSLSIDDTIKLKEQGPLFSQAIGLALETKDRIDLLPEEIKEKRLTTRLIPAFFSLALILIIILSFFTLNLNKNHKRTLQKFDSLKSAISGSQTELTPEVIKLKIDQFKLMKETIDKIDMRRDLDILIYSKITKLLPKYIMLESISIGNIEFYQESKKKIPFEMSGFVLGDEIDLEVGLYQFLKTLRTAQFLENVQILDKDKAELKKTKILKFSIISQLKKESQQ